MLKKLLDNLPFVRSYFSGIATIFMLHRVDAIDDSKLFSNENMKVSPGFLDEFIKNLKAKDYHFISLDRLYDILISGEKVKNQIVLTLDDGYLDNYTQAYAIFKKHNVPFAIYITTSFPKYNAVLWWYALEDLILNNNQIQLADGSCFDCMTKKQKEETFLSIRSIILSFNKENFLEQLNGLFVSCPIDWQARNHELCMSWENIVELSRDPLCTIAGHTKNHYALNQLSEQEVVDEIVLANKEIEKKIGRKVEHFAYPFGSRVEIGQREFDIAKKLGFKTITTTRYGTVYHLHKNHLEALPRVMLTDGFDIKKAHSYRKIKVVIL